MIKRGLKKRFRGGTKCAAPLYFCCAFAGAPLALLSPDTFTILCIEFKDRHGKEVRLKMLEGMFKAGGFVKGLIAKIPYLGVIKTVKTSTFTYILAGSLAFVI